MGLFDSWWGNRGPKITYGTSDDDEIRDSYRDDYIFSGAGQDTISLSYGDDNVNGSSGHDTVEIRGLFSDYDFSSYFGNLGYTPPDSDQLPPDDIIVLEHDRYGTKNLRDVEFIRDSSGAVYQIQQTEITVVPMNGTENSDIITDSFGDNDIFGYGGDDQIYVTRGYDNIYGGDGEDTVVLDGSLDDYQIRTLQEDNETIVLLFSENYGTKELHDVENVVDTNGQTLTLTDTSSDDFFG